MGTYAVMSGNTVSNVIVTDDVEDASNALHVTLIEYTSENPAGIGWTYDQETGKFVQPEPVEIDPIQEANDKLIAAGLSQDEINALINKASLQEPQE